MIFDIDDFKQINDTYGHSAGDKVITELVKATNKQLRKTDLFGRYGGEEFVILLPECGVVKAMEVAERVRRACRQLCIQFDDQEIQIQLSLGVAMVLEEDDSFEETLSRADDALYRAKAAGKDQCWFYDSARRIPIALSR